MVTLYGSRGGEPSADTGDFLRYAQQELRHPIIAELLAGAEPLGEVTVTRTTANRRYFYERMPAWPENFVVLGDAVCALNPVYGHGMSVSAQSALALRDALRRRGGLGAAGLSRHVQKEVGRTVRTAWDLAIGVDVFYPGATESGPTLRDRVLSAYVGRLLHTATGNGRIARRVTDVTSLERGPETLLTPSMLVRRNERPRGFCRAGTVRRRLRVRGCRALPGAGAWELVAQFPATPWGGSRLRGRSGTPSARVSETRPPPARRRSALERRLR